jgi:quercetin dioxygenase-like cupin family protein
MKIAYAVLAATVIGLAGTGTVTLAQGTDHKLITPQEVKWTKGPASLAPGAEVAVLYGDPSKDELFAMRLKLPKGFKIAPHTHPKPEIVTVISGTFRLGMGEKADPGNAKALPAGSLFALSPGMAHFAFIDEDAVVQLNSTGPWTINYINPADDPRKK